MRIVICASCIKTILFCAKNGGDSQYYDIEAFQTIKECHYNHAIMGHKCDLTPSEKNIELSSELS